MICFKSMGFDRNLNQDYCLNRDFQDFQDYCLNRDFQDYRIFRIREEGVGWVYTCMDVYGCLSEP